VTECATHVIGWHRQSATCAHTACASNNNNNNIVMPAATDADVCRACSGAATRHDVHNLAGVQ